jgi:hypothetical protein
MSPTRWRGDCSRCAALCCVSLAFDRSELFAFDKAAGEPCALLGPNHACSIHAERARRGLGGCIAYDCLGAGQRVIEEVFGGRSWQAEPALVGPMLEAFWRMRRVHELRLGLELTERLELAPMQLKRRRELERELDPPGGFSRETLDALALEVLTQSVREFLVGLRGRLAPHGSGERAQPDSFRRRLALVAAPMPHALPAARTPHLPSDDALRPTR